MDAEDAELFLEAGRVVRDVCARFEQDINRVEETFNVFRQLAETLQPLLEPDVVLPEERALMLDSSFGKIQLKLLEALVILRKARIDLEILKVTKELNEP